MRKGRACIAAPTTLLLAAQCLGQTSQIADSQAEFSGVQGQDNWYYGMYDRGADADGVYAASDFLEFLPSAWNGSMWGISSPRLLLTLVGGIPTGTETGFERWPVRRWVSEADGTLSITGQLGDADSRGLGITGRLFVDGVEVFSMTRSGPAAPFSVTGVPVSVGSTVDFAIDPNGDGAFDTGIFSAVVTLEAPPPDPDPAPDPDPTPDPDPDPTPDPDPAPDPDPDPAPDPDPDPDPAPVCEADFSADGVVDNFDLLAFVDAFVHGESSADTDGDGRTNGRDMVRFVDMWFRARGTDDCGASYEEPDGHGRRDARHEINDDRRANRR